MASNCSILERLPPEIIEHIIDQFADYKADPNDSARIDAESLKACSLTCQAFLPLARKHLFHSIVLEVDSQAFRFAELIWDSPALAHYVRFLDYMVKRTHIGNPLLPAALQRLINLTSINISARKITWLEVPAALRSSLLDLIHLPSIRCLHLEAIPDIAPHEILPCPNLKELELYCLSAEFLPKTVLQTKPIQLERLLIEGRGSEFVLDMLNTRDSQDNPVLDLDKVTDYAIFDIKGGWDFRANEEVMMRMRNLEKLHVAFDDEACVAGLVLRHSETYKRLKALHLDLELRGDDPLSGICDLFRTIEGRNPIEWLKLDIVDPEYLIQDNMFALNEKLTDIEEILLRPGWNRLTNLHLRVTVSEGGEDEMPTSFKQILEDKIKAQINPCFKKLSAKKSFKFDYVIVDLQGYRDWLISPV